MSEPLPPNATVLAATPIGGHTPTWMIALGELEEGWAGGIGVLVPSRGPPVFAHSFAWGRPGKTTYTHCLFSHDPAAGSLAPGRCRVPGVRWTWEIQVQIAHLQPPSSPPPTTVDDLVAALSPLVPPEAGYVWTDQDAKYMVYLLGRGYRLQDRLLSGFLPRHETARMLVDGFYGHLLMSNRSLSLWRGITHWPAVVVAIEAILARLQTEQAAHLEPPP